MSNMTFLEENQIFGDDALDIIKKYGAKCVLTDFAVFAGGDVSNSTKPHDDEDEINCVGSWWTKTSTGRSWGDTIKYVPIHGESFLETSGHEGRLGARIAVPYSDISSHIKNERIGYKGIKEVEYGRYPQNAVNKELNEELENLYNLVQLVKTENDYTIHVITENRMNEFVMNFDSYSYKGEEYIRIDYFYDNVGKNISNNSKFYAKPNNIYWIKVEPIVWLIDEPANIALTKKALFSGVKFDQNIIYNGNFEKTDIKQFIDEDFSREIVQDYIVEDNKPNVIEAEKKTLKKENPYDFNFDKVSEEDIIRGAVESNIAVFLHGRSSEGKSARVKQLDKDCEIIYLGTATPESLNGKSVYDASTGEMKDVPPTWFKKISKKCEEEPDKIHIVFFDELTNAMPSIQKYAFNIVLDKEVNGIWQLPKNCRVVAAGNEIEDSLAANQMAEPLFNRFAHVYINTTVESWLKWAVTPDSEYERIDYKEEEKQLKIHPSIYSYIAYKSCMKKSVLRTKYDGIKPNADPRKWEMASKVLYATKNPNMLRGLIGEDLTKDFVNFCKQEVITIEDVVSGNYNQSDLNMNLGEKFVTAVGLSRVEEKDLRVVRECVGKLGAEIQATFDSLWAHGDEKRLEKLAHMQIENNSVRR